MRAAHLVALTILCASLLVLGPPAEARPRRVSSCPFTATSDVVVTKDLSCPGTSGIVVGRKKITIDLGGHTVTGDRTPSTFGVDTAGFPNVTIRNGTLEKFETGVEAVASAHVALRNLVISGNADWGLFDTGSNGSARAVTASGNGLSGLQFTGPRPSVVGSETSNNHDWGVFISADRGVVRRTVATKNGSSGIQLSGQSEKVLGATTNGNGNWGVFISGGAAVVRGVRAVANGFTGVQLSGVGARVSKISADGNGDWGVFVSGDHVRVSSIAADGNAFTGVQINSDRASLSRVEASANAQDGIFIAGANDSARSLVAGGNGMDGIHLLGDQMRLRASRAIGNHDDGINVSGSGARIGRLRRGRASDRNVGDANGLPNGVSDAVGLGINVHNFTIAPVGQNIATGNDNPAECSPANLC